MGTEGCGREEGCRAAGGGGNLGGNGTADDALRDDDGEAMLQWKCGSGNHGGSGGVEGGRSGSDGGGKDGWQRGGGTWQQEQRFGHCSGAAARIGGRRRATAKMAAAMNGARCGGARRGQSAPSSLPQTQPQSLCQPTEGFPEDCLRRTF